MNIHFDNNVGLAGDKIFWMTSADGKKFWCRQPISIMGVFNTSEEYRKIHSPFEKQYKENFIEGKGMSKDEALRNMEINANDISSSFWI